MSSVIFRLITSLILFLFTVLGFGQVEPKLYAGINPYIDKSFESEVYGGFEIGAEVLRFKFLAPEVGFQFLSGQPDAVEDLDLDSDPPVGIGKYEGDFKAYTLSIAPKLLFGDEEAALIILPAYHTGRFSARERYSTPSQDGYVLEEESSESSPISFWNFSAGVQGDFFGLDNFSFAALLTYTTLDSEQFFSELDAFGKNYSGGSSDGIGMSVRVFYHLF